MHFSAHPKRNAEAFREKQHRRSLLGKYAPNLGKKVDLRPVASLISHLDIVVLKQLISLGMIKPI